LQVENLAVRYISAHYNVPSHFWCVKKLWWNPGEPKKKKHPVGRPESRSLASCIGDGFKNWCPNLESAAADVGLVFAASNWKAQLLKWFDRTFCIGLWGVVREQVGFSNRKNVRRLEFAWFMLLIGPPAKISWTSLI
jgi:hypothetical protein